MTNSNYNFPLYWTEVTSDLFSTIDRFLEIDSSKNTSIKLCYRFTKEGDSYIASFDLPGVKKEDIKTSVENSILSINATRKIGKEEIKYQERFRLPKTVSVKTAKATYIDGVLTLVFGENKDAVTEIAIE